MKHIIEAYSAIICISLMVFVSIVIITASGEVVAAKEYKADIMAEIENSNFNPEVINECILQAEALGYKLEVANCTYDVYNDINTAEVILTYNYRMPLLGVSVTKTTRGIVR